MIYSIVVLLNKNKKNNETINIPSDYIAVFHDDGKTEKKEMYVYKVKNNLENSGFKYIIVKTRDIDTSKEKREIIDEGETTWTDNIMQIAEKNNIYSYVTMKNDNKKYTTSEFESMFIMN